MPTRSSIILAAVQKLLHDHADHIDRTQDFSAITLRIKLETGGMQVRGIEYHEERIVRTRHFASQK